METERIIMELDLVQKLAKLLAEVIIAIKFKESR